MENLLMVWPTYCLWSVIQVTAQVLQLAHARFGSAENVYFLALFVKNMGPWICCIFYGNHKQHSHYKALEFL